MAKKKTTTYTKDDYDKAYKEYWSNRVENAKQENAEWKQSYYASNPKTSTNSSDGSISSNTSATRNTGSQQTSRNLRTTTPKRTRDVSRSSRTESYRGKNFPINYANSVKNIPGVSDNSRGMVMARRAHYNYLQKRANELDSQIKSTSASSYTERKKLKDELNNIQTEINDYERNQKMNDETLSATFNPDFAEKSKKTESKTGKVSWEQYNNSNDLDLLAMYDQSSPIDRLNQAGGNMLRPVNEWLSKGVFVSPEEYVTQKGNHGAWYNLTDGERAVYYYKANTEGYASANKYLEDMSNQLNSRVQKETYNKEFAENSMLQNLALSAAMAPVNSLGGAFDFGMDVIGKVTGQDTLGGARAGNITGALTQNTSQQIENWNDSKLPFVNFGWADAYQATMSAIDSGVGAVTLGGAHLAMMASSAAANRAKELYDSGATNEQIARGSLLSGAIEMVTEKYSLDNFLGQTSTRTGKELVKQTLKQAGIEASEEMASEVLNAILDVANRGSQSEFYQDVSKNGAWGALGSLASNTLKAGLGGALSGGMMAGTTGALNLGAYNAETSRRGSNIARNGDASVYLDYAQNNDVSDDLRTRADAVQQILNQEKLSKKDARTVGEFAQSVTESQYEDAQREAIRENLTKDGVAPDESYVENVLKEVNNTAEVSLGDRDAVRDARSMRDTDEFQSAVSDKYTDSRMNMVRDYGIRETSRTTEESVADKVDESSNKKIKNVSESTQKDGKTSYTFLMEDGSKVSSDDIVYTDTNEAVMYETAMSANIDTNSANTFTQAFNAEDGISATTYMRGMAEAYQYGKYGYPLSKASTDGFLGELTDAQKQLAYNSGRQYAVSQAASAQASVNARKGSKSNQGKVVYSQSVRNITNSDNVSLGVVEHIAKNVTHSNIVLYASEVRDGKRVLPHDIGGMAEGASAPNGFYVEGNNTIYLDVNAGNNGEGSILYTLSHELTHQVKAFSPEKYDTLAKFLTESYGDSNIDVDTLVQRQIAKAKANGRTISPDTAFDEVVADSMQTMLTDHNVLDKIEALKAKDRTLARKFLDLLKDIGTKLREAYKNFKPDSLEAQYVERMSDRVDRLADLFAESLVDAGNNIQTINDMRTSFDGAVGEDGTALFQYRAMEHDEATYREMLTNAGMEEDEINSLFGVVNKAIDKIKDNLEALDYNWEMDIDDRSFKTVKPNSDPLYKYSVDFSTLCRKRILQQAVQMQLQQALNRAVTREESIAIRNELIQIQNEGKEIEVACALCYVESARMKSPVQIQKFLDNRRDLITEFLANKDGNTVRQAKIDAEQKARERLAREYKNDILEGSRTKAEAGDKYVDPNAFTLTRNGNRQYPSLKQLPTFMAKEIRDAKREANKAYQLTDSDAKELDYADSLSTYDFTSPEGLADLAKNHPMLFDAYTSFVRNATKSKGLEKDTWWRAGDSYKDMTDDLIGKMNAENGLRAQSWSDYQVIHTLDYIAAIIELSTRKAKMQAYTKVPDYVRLMGNTNQMINLSLIPTREFNGSLEYDPVEGMPFDKAKDLRDKYPATAGTICIGIDNNQIQQLLADAKIDYVIPYHQSGMSKVLRKAMNIPTWVSYEQFQGEKNLSDSEAIYNAKRFGLDTSKAWRDTANWHVDPSFSDWFNLADAQKSAQDWNKKTNLTQEERAEKEKYGVMFGAYKAMQEAGNKYLTLCAERGLAPKFSAMEKADFTGESNYWKLLIDRKMINNKTGEIIEQMPVTPRFNEEDVLGILNDEVERYGKVKADQDYATRTVVRKFLSGEMNSEINAIQKITGAVKTAVDNVTSVNIMESGKAMHSDRDSVGNTLSTEQQKFFSDSKMRDENGNLIPMYHGTDSATFTVFDPAKSDDGRSLFFTSDSSVANSYSPNGIDTRTVDPYKPLEIKTPDDFNSRFYDKEYGDGFRMREEDGQFIIENIDFEDDVVTADNIEKAIKEFERDWYQEDIKAGKYAVYLDIKNPMIVDAGGSKWNALQNGTENTRSIAEKAKAEGYDGVIFKNIVDMGAYSDDSKTSTVAVAFSSEQVKSVDNKKPTSNPDIRFSDRDQKMAEQKQDVDAQIQKENAKLKEDVAYLRELVKLQSKVTNGDVLRPKSIERVAKSIMNSANVRGESAQVTSMLTDIYNYVHQNEGVDWDGFVEKANPLLDYLEKNAAKPTGEYSEDAKRMLDYFDGKRIRLSEKQMQEVRNRFDSYDNYRKSMFGRVTFTSDPSAISLDELWSSIESEFPGVFMEGLADVDQPEALYDAINDARDSKNQVSDEYAYYADMRRQENLERIYDGYWNVSTLHTVADRYDEKLRSKDKQIEKRDQRIKNRDQKILDLKAKHAAQMTELKQSHKAKEDHLRAQFLTEKNALRAQSKAQAEIAKRNAQLKMEDKKRRNLRQKIRNISEDFQKRLIGKIGHTYVPVGLANGIIDVCAMIDPTSADQESQASQKYQNVRQALLELKSEYDKLKEVDNHDFSSEFDEEFSSHIGQLADTVKNTPVRDMTLEQLETVHDIMSDLQFMVRTATKQIGKEDAKSNYELAKDVIENMDHVSDLKLNRGKIKKVLRTWTLNPMRAVLEMSGYDRKSSLYKTFSGLNQGIRDMNRFKMETAKMFDEITNGKNRKKFNSAVDKVMDFGITDTDGNNVPMTKMQAMSIILTWNREHANKGRSHLNTAVEIVDPKLDAKGKHEEAHQNSKQVRVTQATVDQIMGKLSDWDKQYMEVCRSFFNEKSKNAVNETSLLMKGRMVATEKEYFPYTVDTNYTASEPENIKFDASVMSSGILKAMQVNSEKPIIIRNLNAVVDDHTNKVAKIYGLAIPVRNWNKVYNGLMTKDDGSRSVQDAIFRTWGKDAQKLITQAVADIQSPRKGDTFAPFAVAKSGFVSSTLAGNISVVIKQAASYPTAGAVLNPASLTLGIADYATYAPRMKKLFNEIDEHTSNHWIRRQGMTSQEYGDMVQDKGFMLKINNRLGALSPMNWIQAVDVGTTAALWLAAKREAAMHGFKPGTDAFWNETTRLYDQVIEDTQPMYDPLHRAEITKNKVAQTFVMFQTQPLQNSGILHEASGELKAKLKDKYVSGKEKRNAGKKYVMAVGSQAASHFVFTYMTLLAAKALHKMNPWRDKDGEVTDESVRDTFLRKFTENYFGAILPVVGSYAATVVNNIVNGTNYAVLTDATVDKVNGTIETFTDLVSAMQNDDGSFGFGDMEQKLPAMKDGLVDMMIEVASYLGIPARNIENIRQGILLHFEDYSNGELFSYEAGTKRTKKQSFNIANKALASGDDSKIQSFYDSAYQDSLGKGKTEKQAKSDAASSIRDQVKTAYTSGNMTKENAEDVLARFGGLDRDGVNTKIEYWDYKNQNPSTTISEDDMVAYGKVDDTGIKLEDFAKYRSDINGIEGEDKDHDGKTDSGSKKKNILSYINGLNLTKEQKDAMYYAYGYAPKDIKNAPWH